MFRNFSFKKSLFSSCYSTLENNRFFGIDFRNYLRILQKNKIYGSYKFSTIDAKQINNFDAYSSYSWFPETHDSILLKFNHLRTSFLLEHISNKSASLNGPLSGKKILDIGSGAGIFSERLSELGGDVLGVDASYKSIDIAYKNALCNSTSFKEISKFNNENELNNFMNSMPKPRSLRYFKGGIEHIQKSEIFDIIVASEVIEHVNNPGIFVKLISKFQYLRFIISVTRSGNLLKKDGIVLFTTLNRTVLCYIYSIIFGEKIFEMIPKVSSIDYFESIHEHRGHIAGESLLNRMNLMVLQEKMAYIK
ncbi:Coenzyme Q3, methyltransferase [Cryptosporidium parvum Iowa II]|uniref:Coenzyme Q3, methyltransferase, putative n=2 Tax=Cryptosporidium parvum TaxID=5807 RepID=A3FQ89_CRYPI|nr:Coenzyme Q3, methyltransferase [Cryptosporidium parvum Iowa II]EAZ51398.1 Coenzyme Q3, methyltransferase, putative [Cryptosporidium parvum Iowa II]QOY42948.1 Coenzyme Q3/methyltransferase [Cryptosporidium parvum]WKS76581.1 putative Coenzyme Q3, methyltransferase [Cryptosporidium sp. 43IA8]WRK31074.1 hypothetical protein cpbgf_2002830 [Cryptosporidium parvum]|eukprot:QOY42948.1 hypothetical protein CPATCC_000639 [Cryptosporidium parvum]